jgi:hypothetical protein
VDRKVAQVASEGNNKDAVPDTEAVSGNDTASSVVGVLVCLVVLAALVLLLKGLFPPDLPDASDPNFIDAIFNNKAVIWAARILLVSAAVVLAVGGVFIIASTVVRMRKGDWLKRAGPFEVSEMALSEIEDQIEFWRNTALTGQDEIAELRERLEASDDLIEQLHLALDDG